MGSYVIDSGLNFVMNYELLAKGPEKDLKSLNELFYAEGIYKTVREEIEYLDYLWFPTGNEKLRSLKERLIFLWLPHDDKSYKAHETDSLIQEIYDTVINEYGDVLNENQCFKTELEKLINSLKGAEIKKGLINPPEKHHLGKNKTIESSFSDDGHALHIKGQCWAYINISLLSNKGSFGPEEHWPETVKTNWKGKSLDQWAEEHPDTSIEIAGYDRIRCVAEQYIFRNGTMADGGFDGLVCGKVKSEEDIDSFIEEFSEHPEDAGRVRKCMEAKNLWATDEKNKPIFPVFVDMEHPGYLIPADDIATSGKYSPVFSI